MQRAAELCRSSSLKYGVDKAFVLSEEHIADGFRFINKDVFDGKRGAGCYWLFKPYAIYWHLLNWCSDGDYFLYSDAGVEFINPVQQIIDAMDSDVFLFTNSFKQVEWCKGNVMDTILPEWRDGRYNNAMQVQASNIFIRVSKYSREFVKRWLCYCQMPNLINDEPSETPNFTTFADHRHDQAILTALAIKENMELHWFPTTTAHHIRWMTPKDQYGEVFLHHRKRDNEW
jgi:hypothetical protein